jgi:hypothetical protein
MIRYVLPAAIAMLAIGAPAALHAQTAPPPQPLAPNMTTNTNATVTGQPQPGVNDDANTQANQTYGQPMAQPGQPMAPPAPPMAQPAQPPGPMQPGFTPRTVWIPGTYNWDPAQQRYAWANGQYVEAPRENAQWLPGHWAQTPTAWIWLDGRWQ